MYLYILGFHLNHLLAYDLGQSTLTSYVSLSPHKLNRKNNNSHTHTPHGVIVRIKGVNIHKAFRTTLGTVNFQYALDIIIILIICQVLF